MSWASCPRPICRIIVSSTKSASLRRAAMRCVAAYVSSAGGPGESTTDLAWDGHALIYENGEMLAEAERFAADEQMIIGDIDLERLIQERMRLTSFNDTVGVYRERLRALRRGGVEFLLPPGRVARGPAGGGGLLPATARG